MDPSLSGFDALFFRLEGIASTPDLDAAMCEVESGSSLLKNPIVPYPSGFDTKTSNELNDIRSTLVAQGERKWNAIEYNWELYSVAR